MVLSQEQPVKKHCKSCGEPFWTEVMFGAPGNQMYEKAAELCLKCWLESSEDFKKGECHG